MTGILQILFLIAAVIGGGYLGMWLRRFEMSGFELWFPLGMIISYAISPLVGFIVAFSMMAITWALFPYGVHNLAITAVSFGAIYFIGKIYFPITDANFFMTAMILSVIFQGVSNIFYFLTGHSWFRIIKFIVLNLLLCAVVFMKFGWQLLQWLK